ncbi:MAG: methyltransferase domain-containing protein [Myxococcota bacterium]
MSREPMIRYRGLSLHYTCDTEALPKSLRNRFRPLGLDDSTKRWIDNALEQPHSDAVMQVREAVRRKMSDYDINGTLGIFSMRVLGTRQWQALLGQDFLGARLLDVGAGDGQVTRELAPLFESVEATETSLPMVERLKRLGYSAFPVDLTNEISSELLHRGFDMVTLLNVIDRTKRPITLMENIARFVGEQGYLALAVPLPLRPHVQVGGHICAPEEQLPADSRSWEAGVTALTAYLLQPLGWHVDAFSRAPYLCRGNQESPVQILDDVVFLCRRRSTT